MPQSDSSTERSRSSVKKHKRKSTKGRIKRLERMVEQLVHSSRHKRRRSSSSSSSDSSNSTPKRSRRSNSGAISPPSGKEQASSNEHIKVLSNEHNNVPSNGNSMGSQGAIGKSDQTDDILIVDVLDTETAALLGDMPGSTAPKGPSFHPEISGRWNAIAKSGLSKEERDKITNKHPVAEGLIIEGAKLNPELVSAIPEYIKVKDDSLRRIQDHVATAATALGAAMNFLATEKCETSRLHILAQLSDAGRYLMGTQYALSLFRRKQVTGYVKDTIMTRILAESEVYPYLFGSDLSTQVKNAKSLTKVGHDIANKSQTETKSVRISTGRTPPASDKKTTYARKSAPLNYYRPLPSSSHKSSFRRNNRSNLSNSVGQVNESHQVSHAGRLRHFYTNWLALPNVSEQILSFVKGYRFPFRVKPKESLFENKQFSHKEELDIDNSISDLLLMGAVQTCKHVEGQFVSPIFLVPKPDGSHRFIINLKHLNTYLITSKFKMEDLRSAIKLMSKDCYMVTIDLKDAYYMINVAQLDRKFIRFQWKNILYEFTCVCFGQSTAPWLFTKLLRPVISKLRNMGFVSVIYLDDILLFGNTFEECQGNIQATISLLESLGFVINFTKSSLIPSQSAKYLGFILNSSSMTVALPDDKCLKLGNLCKSFLSKSTVTARQLAELIGSLVACIPAVPYGMLYTKRLERSKFLALSKNRLNFNVKLKLEASDFEDISWWIRNLPGACAPIRTDSFDFEIFSDASLTGWGVYSQGSTANGLWNSNQSCHSINYLELVAAYYGLRCFARDLSNVSILLRIDNTTALNYINRMGSIQYPHLSNVTRDIWNFCEQRHIWIFASYIRSRDNFMADKQSRIVHSESEWGLSNEAFQNICQHFGNPAVDLFASCQNAKCKSYVSWKPDPFAFCVDAFTLNWNSYNSYIFPPFNLVLRVLKKIKSDKAKAIVVVPFWECQPWFPVYMSMLITRPLILNPKPNLLSFGSQRHPMSHTLSLMAGLLSGMPC